MKEYPIRKSPRLKALDYSQTAFYFITVCTKEKQKTLGKVVLMKNRTVGEGLDPPGEFGRAVVVLSELGKLVERELLKIPSHFDDVKLVKYCIMPNHIHMILSVGCDDLVEGGSRPSPTNVVNVVGLFKAGVSRNYGNSVWQRSFYDHVIRGQEDFEKIWEYIETNPLRWKVDCYY